jgi:hypothetical protein
MTTDASTLTPLATEDRIPLPIVKLNRWTLLVGVLAGFVTGQPLATTALFLILLAAVLFGPRWSLIAQVGRRLFVRGAGSDYEDRRLMRFNNLIATLLLGLAQIAFVLDAPVIGWALALMVAAAAAIALAGFCVGCFLYYQLKLQRSQLFGR